MREIYVPVLTDHAVKRCIARFNCASREEAETFVLTPLVRQWLAWGANRIWDHNGFCVVADQGRVLTVYEREGKRSRKYE